MPSLRERILETCFERISAEVAIWDRGLGQAREEPGIPYEALIAEPIPASLSDESPLWKCVRS